jgi:hypothetical protein
MTNITITVDEQVACWVRIEAAKRNTSISRLVGEILGDRMRATERYETARQQFFEIEARPLRRGDARLPSREDLHDRAGLR